MRQDTSSLELRIARRVGELPWRPEDGCVTAHGTAVSGLASSSASTHLANDEGCAIHTSISPLSPRRMARDPLVPALIRTRVATASASCTRGGSQGWPLVRCHARLRCGQDKGGRAAETKDSRCGCARRRLFPSCGIRSCCERARLFLRPPSSCIRGERCLMRTLTNVSDDSQQVPSVRGTGVRCDL